MATNEPVTIEHIPEEGQDNFFVKAANIEGNRVIVQVNTNSGNMDVVKFSDMLSDLRNLANDEEVGNIDRATLGLVYRLLRGMNK